MKTVFFILSIFLVISACKKEITKCPKDFIINGIVEPYSLTYKIGDTIELIVDSEKMIWDKETEGYYDLSSVNLDCLFLIYDISVNNGSYAISHVTNFVKVINDNIYKPKLQDFSDGSQIVFSDVIFINGRFKTRLQFIPIDTGNFMLTYGPYLIEDKQEFLYKCKNTSTDLSTRLNIDKDNNIDLLKESPNEYFNTWMVSDPERFYETKSGFAYRVIE